MARAALKLVHVTKALAEKHYEDLASKPFFPGLVDDSAPHPFAPPPPPLAPQILLAAFLPQLPG